MASNLWSAKASEKGHYISRGLSEFVSNSLTSWNVPGTSIAVVDGDDFLTEVSAWSSANPQSLAEKLEA